MAEQVDLKKRFREKAEAVSAVVTDIGGMDEAMTYVLDVCERKPACELLISGCGESLSDPARDLCRRKTEKVIAAPGLDPSLFDAFQERCRERGIDLVGEGLRRYLAGIDIGFTGADYGIAETGTLVLDSAGEEIRLATMIAEVHIAFLPVSRLVPNAFQIEEELAGGFRAGPGMTAFITGASRTADIERVLAIGVHGPLELHILLLEDG